MATTLATTFWSLASFSQGVQDIIEETEEPQEELREERAAQARAKKEEEEAKLAAFDVLFVTLVAVACKTLSELACPRREAHAAPADVHGRHEQGCAWPKQVTAQDVYGRAWQESGKTVHEGCKWHGSA